MHRPEEFTGSDNCFFLPVQQTLREKLVELQALTVQEKRLTRGERVFSAVKPQHFLSHSPRLLSEAAFFLV